MPPMPPGIARRTSHSILSEDCIDSVIRNEKNNLSKETMTMDMLRAEVKAITAEELSKEPSYYKTICSVTGLKKAQDMLTLTFLSIYFGSFYILWNWNLLVGDKLQLDVYSPLMQVAWYAVLYTNIYFSFLGSVITHNTMHTPIFKNRTLNKVVQLVLSLSYGHPVSSYVPGHNLSHHKYTQTKKDVMSTHLMQSKWNLFNLIFFQPTVGLNVLQSDFRYISYEHEQGHFLFVSQAMREIIVLLTVNTLLMYLSFSKFFFIWYVPHFFAQYMIVTLSMLQHDGCETFHPGQDSNQSSINFNTSRNFTNDFLNFFTLNNGYHTIHHLAPTSHWSLGKKLHEKLILKRIDNRLDEESMLAFVIRHYISNGNPWNIESRKLDYKGLPIQYHKLDFGCHLPLPKEGLKKGETRLFYEEWLSFPETFDRSRVPCTKGALIQCIAALILKVAISPVYSVNPQLSLI